MEYQTINTKIENDIAVIEMKQLEKMNAIDREVIKEISAFLESSDMLSKAKVLVITGKDGVFSAGADVNMKLPETVSDGYDLFNASRAMFNRIESMPIPVIACINGLAFGGGLELALCCDLRFASVESLLGLPEVNLGIIPAGGGTQRLPKVVGVGFAKEICFLGNPLTAGDALDIRLVNKVFPKEQLMEETLKTARKLSRKAPLSIQMVKKSINVSAGLGDNPGFELEILAAAGLAISDDFKEGIAALSEKRKPDFKGR